MAVKISKQASKLLNKHEARLEAKNPTIPKSAGFVVEPSSNDPNKSMIAALRVLPARKGHQTLMMIRRKDGKATEVVDYYPAQNKFECRFPYTEDKTHKTKYQHYTVPIDSNLEKLYQPLWR